MIRPVSIWFNYDDIYRKIEPLRGERWSDNLQIQCIDNSFKYLLAIDYSMQLHDAVMDHPDFQSYCKATQEKLYNSI